MQVSHYLPVGANDREKPYITPDPCAAVLIVYQQPVNHGNVKSAAKMGQAELKARSFQSLQKMMNCTVMHEQTFTQTHTFITALRYTHTHTPIHTNHQQWPVKWKKKRCSGWWSMVAYPPARWGCGATEGDVITTGAVIGCDGICSHAWPGWISHMDSSPWAWWNAWFSSNFTHWACIHQQWQTDRQTCTQTQEDNKQNRTMTLWGWKRILHSGLFTRSLEVFLFLDIFGLIRGTFSVNFL